MICLDTIIMTDGCGPFRYVYVDLTDALNLYHWICQSNCYDFVIYNYEDLMDAICFAMIM